MQAGSSSPTLTAEQATSANGRSGELFGHPTCLFTLFFAEMWERFSFYGMKALLILYMVNYLFWRQDEASQVMRWYTMLVYATPILGGFIADRWLGARWSVVVGGVLLAIGHTLLAFEPLPFFYSGLGFIIAGVGFLKPNISTQVGALYRANDERRDAAFTLFYMGINVGAFLGPIVCDWLRLHYGWHYGFGAAGVGMVFGLIVYIFGMGAVVRRTKQIAAEDAEAERTGELAPTPAPRAAPPPSQPKYAAEADTHGAGMTRIHLDRSIVLVVICVFAILFWVGFEQAANVMNLWADQHTNLHVFRGEAPPAALPGAEAAADAPGSGGMWGRLRNWQMGAAMTQSINPLFIIVFAGVFAWLWQYLQRRGRQPSTPMKMALGVLFLAFAYGILLLAVQAEGRRTSAPLASLPPAFQTDERGAMYTLRDPDTGDRRDYYGATRLHWDGAKLTMNGVLSDIDWMRALGASSPPVFREIVDQLAKVAEDRSVEVGGKIRAGELPADAAWEVSVEVPPEVGELEATAGWPTESRRGQELPKVVWDSEARILTATATLSERDKAQLLATGADPEFRAAVTALYLESSVFKVSILWLLAFYLVLTIGELCLSPVGLSLVTKAAPPKMVGLFMGLWFLTTGAVANWFAHYAGGYWGMMTPAEYFMIFAVLGIVATVIMLVLLRFLKPLLHGIH